MSGTVVGLDDRRCCAPRSGGQHRPECSAGYFAGHGPANACRPPAADQRSERYTRTRSRTGGTTDQQGNRSAPGKTGVGTDVAGIGDLMAHVKFALEAELLAASCRQRVFAPGYPEYFPSHCAIVRSAIKAHPLRRQIVATMLANEDHRQRRNHLRVSACRGLRCQQYRRHPGIRRVRPKSWRSTRCGRFARPAQTAEFRRADRGIVSHARSSIPVAAGQSAAAVRGRARSISRYAGSVSCDGAAVRVWLSGPPG